MHLNQQIKTGIVKNLILRKFGAPTSEEVAQKKLQKAFLPLANKIKKDCIAVAKAAYETVYTPKIQKLIAQLPEEMRDNKSDMRVKFVTKLNKRIKQADIEFNGVVSCRLANIIRKMGISAEDFYGPQIEKQTIYSGPCAEIKDTHPLYRKYKQIDAALTDLTAQLEGQIDRNAEPVDKFEKTLYAMLNQFNTVEKLIKATPEIKTVVEEVVGPLMQVDKTIVSSKTVKSLRQLMKESK